jgi:hypothetical protein
VFEAARLKATNLGPWAGIPASGLPVDLEVLILFPWDPESRLFNGEKIWFDASGLGLAVRGSALGARNED